jgi:hypothetical protein
MEDKKATSDQLVNALDASLIRAWLVEGTINGDKLTALWLDGTSTEATLVRTGKRKPARCHLGMNRKGE